MRDRKQALKQLLHGGARLAIDPTPWRGVTSLATQHSVYRLVDGVCVAIHRQDTGNGRADFVGMRIVGWLVEDAGAARIAMEWRPGASAIFVRPGVQGEPFALTSPVIHARGGTSVTSSGVIERVAPPARQATVDSLTRIGVATRAKT